MAYIDYCYYSYQFLGVRIEEKTFERLANVATDVIDMICDTTKTDDEELVKKAVAYQIEYLVAQGGIDAITGNASAFQVTSEHLDDYSITSSQSESAKEQLYSVNGIPVSPLSIALLKKAGLIQGRWVYHGRRCPNAYR